MYLGSHLNIHAHRNGLNIMPAIFKRHLDLQHQLCWHLNKWKGIWPK